MSINEEYYDEELDEETEEYYDDYEDEGRPYDKYFDEPVYYEEQARIHGWDLSDESHWR